MAETNQPWLGKRVDILDKGWVELQDVMGDDNAIVAAARASFLGESKGAERDKRLLFYLLRHRHTTPFEMVEFKFHIAMPIFVARQWIRHRTANVNEYSARYSIVPDRFYRPTLENIRQQSATNRQGGETPVDHATAEEFLSLNHLQ